jgi:hypothetical protein
MKFHNFTLCKFILYHLGVFGKGIFKIFVPPWMAAFLVNLQFFLDGRSKACYNDYHHWAGQACHKEG